MTDVDREALPSSDRLEMFSDGVLAIAVALALYGLTAAFSAAGSHTTTPG
jgi:uncharacterized membrane protein